MGGTRVTLDSVVTAFCDGASAEEIAQQFPSLALADVYAVVAYFLGHRSEVEHYLHSRREGASRIRDENEARLETANLRDRLMARSARGS